MRKCWFFVLLSAATLCLVPAVAKSETLNLTHRWSFDGNLVDSVGGLNGTAVGNASAGADNGAYSGSGAVAFDGVDDALSIGTAAIGSGSFSLAFWSWDDDDLKTDGYKGYLLCDSSNADNLFMRRMFSGTAPNYRFAGHIAAKDANFLLDGANWPFEVWRQHVFVYDSSTSKANWYVNGALRMTLNSVSWAGLQGNLYLGNNGALGRDYKGYIDDLQIYSGAVTADQAVALYSNPGSVAVPEPNTIILLAVGVIGLAAWAWRKRK